ncbi:ADP binding [Alternaria alternata]|nr:ADP binding [Alternaria alternata]
MGRPEATDFLTKSLVRKDLLCDNAATAKLLDELLDELTCLPLAIAQVAAYLNRNRMSILKYLQLFRSTEQDLVRVISREFRDDTRYKGSVNAVATT